MKAPLVGLVGLGILTAPHAHGFAEFARGEFLLSTTATETYDSRVLGGRSDEDDFITSLRPDLLFRREAGLLKLDASAGVRINRYANFSEFDSDDFLARATLTMPEGVRPRTSGRLDLNYDESTDLDYDVGTRLRTKSFGAQFNTKTVTSLKTSVDLEGGYRESQRQIVSDRETWQGAVAFNYRDFLNGTDLTLRYRRLETETSGRNVRAVRIDQESDSYSMSLTRAVYRDIRGSATYGYRILQRSAAETLTGETESKGSFFSLGLDGPFLPESRFPKLDSGISVSYQESDTIGINDTGSSRLVGTARLSWDARPRTRLSFNVNRAFDLSSDDRTVEATTFSASATQQIGYFTSASLDTSYQHRKYRGVMRWDDIYMVGVTVGYRISSRWSVSGKYQYRDSQSTEERSDFARHLASISGNYTF